MYAADDVTQCVYNQSWLEPAARQESRFDSHALLLTHPLKREKGEVGGGRTEKTEMANCIIGDALVKCSIENRVGIDGELRGMCGCLNIGYSGKRTYRSVTDSVRSGRTSFQLAKICASETLD